MYRWIQAQRIAGMPRSVVQQWMISSNAAWTLLFIPQFYAVDLSRLPPVDVKNIDMPSVLKEPQSLRAEVRELQNLRHEMDSLKQEVKKSRASSRTILPEKD